MEVNGDFRYIDELWNRHRHGERHGIIVYWLWHADGFKTTIGAPQACTITYEGLLKDWNNEVSALCVAFHNLEKLG